MPSWPISSFGKVWTTLTTTTLSWLHQAPSYSIYWLAHLWFLSIRYPAQDGGDIILPGNFSDQTCIGSLPFGHYSKASRWTTRSSTDGNLYHCYSCRSFFGDQCHYIHWLCHYQNGRFTLFSKSFNISPFYYDGGLHLFYIHISPHDYSQRLFWMSMY